MQFIEIFSEMMYMLACAFLMSFLTTFDQEAKNKLGFFFMATIALLICGNVAYVIYTVVQNKKKAKEIKLLKAKNKMEWD